MFNLPFDKWTLKFFSANYEKQYEEHQNEIRMQSFQLINILVTIATLVCLIILLIQRESNVLIIIVILNIGTNFSLSLLNKKLQPYMKQVFSIMFVVGTASSLLINFSDIEIPHYVFGYSAGCLAFCLIQHSDNRLKIIYLITTPTVLLAIFDVFKLSTLQFVVYAYACMIFVGTLIYMNEYISRMAFSLMLLSKKQKDIIYEFVNDAFLAVSFIERTGQFNLEFTNLKCEQEFYISETEQLKIFLRSSFLISRESLDQKKQLSLEELLFQKIKETDNLLSNEFLPEISYQDQKSKVTKILTLQIKVTDFGKPVILLIIQQNQIKQIDNQGLLKQYYRDIILDQSKQLSEAQIKLYNQIKKTRINFLGNQHQSLLQCLNLQIINMIRNYMIYFNKEKLQSQISNFEKCNLTGYLQTLEEYFYILADHQNLRFEVLNTTDSELQINLNTKFLTQIIVNIFHQISQKTLKRGMISLQVAEEPNLNPNQVRNTVSRLESLQKVEQSQQGLNLKLISFSFCYLTNFKNQKSFQPEDQNNPVNFAEIEESVTQILLALLGPYNNGNQIASIFIQEQGYTLVNKLQFYIYSDQSLLDQSYSKYTKLKQNQ